MPKELFGWFWVSLVKPSETRRPSSYGGAWKFRGWGPGMRMQLHLGCLRSLIVHWCWLGFRPWGKFGRGKHTDFRKSEGVVSLVSCLYALGEQGMPWDNQQTVTQRTLSTAWQTTSLTLRCLWLSYLYSYFNCSHWRSRSSHSSITSVLLSQDGICFAENAFSVSLRHRMVWGLNSSINMIQGVAYIQL